jgi:prepilin-type N-terminal cleavage/methylation domain-containing protein
VSHRARGFSIVELIMVMALASSVAAMCLAWVPRLAEVMEADADLVTLTGQVTLAREAATSQRRSVELRFVQPNTIIVARQNLPDGETILSSAVLQHNAQFLLFPNEPDTPDQFGNADAVNLGGAARVMFTADGMLTDEAGNPTNASVFIQQPGRVMTARAFTIFGPTARVRAYRWNGSAWRQ